MADGDFHKNDHDALFRLVGDVGRLKGSMDAHAEATREQWKQLGRLVQGLNEISGKIDMLVAAEGRHLERLDDVEEAVGDYRRTKTRAVSLLAGFGLGTGGLGAVIGAWISKWFG